MSSFHIEGDFFICYINSLSLLYILSSALLGHKLYECNLFLLRNSTLRKSMNAKMLVMERQNTIIFKPNVKKSVFAKYVLLPHSFKNPV